MCSAPVCGILCGQKQSLAGAIPAGLCRILRIPLFHSMNNMKTVRGPPREVGCHKEWDCRAEKLQPGSNKQRMIQALQKPRGSQSITSFSSYCSPPKITPQTGSPTAFSSAAPLTCHRPCSSLSAPANQYWPRPRPAPRRPRQTPSLYKGR